MLLLSSAEDPFSAFAQAFAHTGLVGWVFCALAGSPFGHGGFVADVAEAVCPVRWDGRQGVAALAKCCELLRFSEGEGSADVFGVGYGL